MEKFKATLRKRGKTEAQLSAQFAELEPPELPRIGNHISVLFFELNSGRQSGMNGPLPLSFVEIKAYGELKDINFEPWEIDAIKIMDRAFLSEYHDTQNKESK